MKLPWFQASERVVGLNHATLSDTINRALRQMLTLCGFDPDVDFPGFTPRKSVLGSGATGSGTTDDAPAVAAAETAALAAGLEFAPGSYLFNTNHTFTKPVKCHKGALLKPASGVTLTLPPNIDAGDYQILDYSAGGTFLLSDGGSPVNIRWTGTKGDGTDDTVAFNKAIDLCYGAAGPATRHGLSGAVHNHPLYVPPGTFAVQYLDFSGTIGMVMRGAGRLVTTIQITSSTSVGVLADMAAYGHWEGFIINSTATRDRTHPLVDIDGRSAVGGTYLSTGVGGNYLFPQQWTFDDVYFNGNDIADVNFAWCRLGGGTAQGDTVIFKNCLNGVAKFAGYMFGSETVAAGNVLDIHFIGGDIQSQRMWGIYSQGGTVHIHGTGFQNQGPAGFASNIPYLSATGVALGGSAGATHVGNYAQIDTGGGDVFLHQFSSRGSIRNVRSEGFCLTRGSGIAAVENCETWSGGIIQWAANSTSFVQGILVKTFSGSVSLDGRTWGLFTATPTPITTGGSEPPWASARDGFMQEGVSVTSGSPTITCKAPIRVVNKGTLPGVGGNEWGAIVVDPTGVNGKFYAKVLSHVQNSSVTLDANVPWTGTATIHMGELVTDGGGQWIPYDFIGLEGEFEHVSGQFECGQLSMVNVPTQHINARFSRRDWLYDPWSNIPPFNGGEIVQFPGEWSVLIGPGTCQFSWPLTKHSLIDPALQIRTYALKAARYFLSPLMFPRAWSTTPAGEVGIGGLDGAYTLVGTRTDLTRNAVGIVGGVLAPDPVGFPDAVANPPANTAGHDFVFNGGTSTGTAKSGRIVFATNPGGSAGNSVNDNVESAVVDGDATAGNTRFLLYDVSKATLSRVSVGANDSGGTGFKVLRVPN